MKQYCKHLSIVMLLAGIICDTVYAQKKPYLDPQSITDVIDFISTHELPQLLAEKQRLANEIESDEKKSIRFKIER